MGSLPHKIAFVVSLFFVLGAVWCCFSYVSIHSAEISNNKYSAALSSGWLSGSLHAITGPDHIASLLPIILAQKWQLASTYGLVWGLGHGITSFTMGYLAYILKRYMFVQSPTEIVENYRYIGDLITAITILVIGGMGIYENSGAEEDADSTNKSSSADEETGFVQSKSEGNVSMRSISSCYDSIKLLSVFAHGAALGLSLDGLPSLAPAIVLDDNLVLAFLASYLLSTAVIMALATAIVAQSSQILVGRKGSSSKVDSSTSVSTSRDVDFLHSQSSSSSPESSEKQPDYSQRLAQTSSYLACAIGVTYLALSLYRLTSVQRQARNFSVANSVGHEGSQNDGLATALSLVSNDDHQMAVLSASSPHAEQYSIDVYLALLSMSAVLCALVYALGGNDLLRYRSSQKIKADHS